MSDKGTYSHSNRHRMHEAKDASYIEGFGKGYAKAVAAMREAYEPLLKATAKDSERLDWLMENDCLQDWVNHRAAYGLNEGREYIDAAMKESE